MKEKWISRFCSHKVSNSEKIITYILKLPLLIKEKSSNDLQGSQEHQKDGVILFERNLFPIQNTKAKYELNPYND